MSEKEAETTITGHVIDEKERPVAGAVVACDGSETRTLFDGSYRFENLVPGTHAIEIGLDGYLGQIKQIETEEGGEAVVDFHLEPEKGDTRIFGYVLEKETDEPIRTGGSVYMIRPTFNRNVPFDPETGYFEFADLPTGTYVLWTSVLEYDDEKKTVTVEEGEDRREDFFIRKGFIEPPLG